jgi:predicted GIY-YIG superfamily endonuclease
LERRLAQHIAGTGARYTRGRGPLTVAASWTAGSRSAALKAEAAFKSLPRSLKEQALTSDEPLSWLPA